MCFTATNRAVRIIFVASTVNAVEAYTADGEGAVTGTHVFAYLISKIRSTTFGFIFTPGFERKFTAAFVNISSTMKVFLADVKNLFTLMCWGEWMLTIQAGYCPPFLLQPQ